MRTERFYNYTGGAINNTSKQMQVANKNKQTQALRSVNKETREAKKQMKNR